jgi:hypothetical protein
VGPYGVIDTWETVSIVVIPAILTSGLSTPHRANFQTSKVKIVENHFT